MHIKYMLYVYKHVIGKDQAVKHRRGWCWPPLWKEERRTREKAPVEAASFVKGPEESNRELCENWTPRTKDRQWWGSLVRENSISQGSLDHKRQASDSNYFKRGNKKERCWLTHLGRILGQFTCLKSELQKPSLRREGLPNTGAHSLFLHHPSGIVPVSAHRLTPPCRLSWLRGALASGPHTQKTSFPHPLEELQRRPWLVLLWVTWLWGRGDSSGSQGE